MRFDIWNMPNLAAKLRAEGFEAVEEVFQGQVGLLLTTKKAGAPADFFPLWELNRHWRLLAAREFVAIKSLRSARWPVPD